MQNRHYHNYRCIIHKKNLHRAHSSILPNLPKTRNEVHNVLEEIDIIYYENEQFLLHNDIESGIVLFSTKTNLEFLVKIDRYSIFYYVDGTFQYILIHIIYHS